MICLESHYRTGRGWTAIPFRLVAHARRSGTQYTSERKGYAILLLVALLTEEKMLALEEEGRIFFQRQEQAPSVNLLSR